MKTKEELAEEYADKFDLTKSTDLPYYHNDRNRLEDCFLAGYNACEQKINNLSLFELKELYYEEQRKLKKDY